MTKDQLNAMGDALQRNANYHYQDDRLSYNILTALSDAVYAAAENATLNKAET